MQRRASLGESRLAARRKPARPCLGDGRLPAMVVCHLRKAVVQTMLGAAAVRGKFNAALLEPPMHVHETS